MNGSSYSARLLAGLTPDVFRGWQRASRDPRIDGAIRAIHAAIEETVARERPVCTASARCCHFARTGHALFVTGLEAAWTLDRIAPEWMPTDERLGDAEAAGSCPLLSDAGPARPVGACGVHAVRPSGCRVYFCDPTRSAMVTELAQHAADAVRSLHDRFGVPYMYAEWLTLLRGFVGSGMDLMPTRPEPGLEASGRGCVDAVPLTISPARGG
ncbi:MAG: hypothetical protein AAGB48_05540 [Planctomycetota bacterium]